MVQVLDVETDLDALAAKDVGGGYLAFLDHIVVNSQPRPRYWQDVALPWQKEREEVRAPILDNLAGYNDDYAGPRWLWSGWAKGHDKTPGVGRRLLYLLAYSKHPLQLVACAGDQEQAALITGAMKTEVARNGWLADRVDISNYGAVGDSGSTLSCLPLDAWTGQGISPDYIVADEVTHWLHKKGEQFWDFVLATVSKRPYCMFEVLTNSGFLGSWQHRARNWAEGSGKWIFREQPAYSHMASWMDTGAIDEICKGMTPGEVKRVIRNVWIDPGEENGLVSTAEAETCVDPVLTERDRGDTRNNHFVTVDYGGVIDRCALCVLHPVPGTDRVEIDRLDCWQGNHEHRIVINRADALGGERNVEEWIDTTLSGFPNATLVFDPYQMESLAQHYERRGRRVERFEYRGGKRNMRMAQLIRTMIQNRKLRWSAEAGYLPGAEDDTFAKELGRLVLKPTIYGYRFDHEAGRHDDRAVAVGMGLVYAVPEALPGGRITPKSVGKAPQEPTRIAVPPPAQNWAQRRGLFGMR
jgi:hypothetical protein